MIELKETALHSFLKNAQTQLTQDNDRQLISWTRKISPISLVNAFGVAGQINENRFFWTDEHKELLMAGIGSAIEKNTMTERFHSIEQEWKTIINNALIYNPYEISGTGIVAFSGMTFDPIKAPTDLWSNFPQGKLTIPTYTIVNNKGSYYFTVNYNLEKSSDISQVINEMNDFEALVRTYKADDSKIQQKIVAKREIEPEEWKKSVRKAVAAINNSEADKIVLAREVRVKLNQTINIANILEKLSKTQSTSYIFAFEHDQDCFLGATPERLVKVTGKNVLSTCLAGTSKRGKNQAEDEKIGMELLNDEKNLMEHDYVVKMIQSSIANFCDNIEIPNEPIIYKLTDLQHLYTPVTAEMKAGYTIFDIIEALHPTPALGGVPTESALSFIRDEELLDRGWYGAPVGWVDSNDNGEFAVAIRSGLVQDNEISLFAGCGVMGDSDAEMEYEETNVKLLPLLTVLEDNYESF